MNRDLPRRIVTQGVEINFKYTGQPITCYRCISTKHVVRHCDKQHCARPTVNQRLAASEGGSHPWKRLMTTWTMTLRRRIRNLHRCSLQVTRRSPTQTTSFHLPLLSRDLFDTSLNHENGPTRHWRNRTIPNRNNNALLRPLLAAILLSNSFIQPPNKRVPNVRN